MKALNAFLCFLLCSCFFAEVVAADSDWEELKSRWQQPSHLHSQFQQERHIKVLSKPLISQGEFTFVEEKGICWEMQTPWAQTFLITQSAVYQQQNEKSEKALGSENPMFSAFSQAFFALFSGDVSGMEKWFEMSVVLDETEWNLTLTPKDKSVQMFASQMQLKGDKYLEKVIITDMNNDVTIMRFSNISDAVITFDENEAYCQ